MKKVLVVSYYFPPLNSIAAKRYGTMCKYFNEHGYEAYVLTTGISKSSYLGAKHDLEVPMAAENILRINQNPLHAGIKLKSIFWLDALLKKCKIESRAILAGDFLWYENVRKKIKLEGLKDIDIIIGTYGPIGNIYVAKYLSEKLGCPYIIDIRDLISEWREATKGYKRCFRIDNMVEKILLSSASGITVVTSGFKKIFEKKYPQIKIATIFNGWDNMAFEKTGDTQEKYLYYAGSLYEHRLESFFLLLRALKKVNEKEEIKFIVRSIGPGELDSKAKKMVAEMRMKERVEIRSSATEDIIREEQGRAYINVILSSTHEKNFEQMITVPGKTFELMNEEAPILGVSSKHSEVAALISYTNKGIVTMSENEIVDFVLNNSRKYTGNDNVAKFSRAYQAKRLCKFMDDILREK